MKRIKPTRWNIAKRLLKRGKKENDEEVKVQDIEPEIDTETANSSESRDSSPSPVEEEDIVFREAVGHKIPKKVDGVSPLLSLFNCSMDLKQVVDESESDLLCGADTKQAERDDVLCLAGCTISNNDEPETREQTTPFRSRNKLQNAASDGDDEHRYALKRVRRMDGEAPAKTKQQRPNHRGRAQSGTKSRPKPHDASIVSGASSASFDCIAKDEYLKRSSRSESLVSKIEIEETRSKDVSTAATDWMTSFRTMSRNLSESAQQWAAELTMDESSITPDEQSIYVIRRSSFLSKILEKDFDGEEPPAKSVPGKETPTKILRLSPLSEESESITEEDLALMHIVHSRAMREAGFIMGKFDDESHASILASEASEESASLSDRGANLFYDVEMLRETSKEPLYHYRERTTEESVKGHMVVFDITETMKEVVQVVLDLQRDDLAGLLMVLVEDLVSTLGILRCAAPVRPRLTELKEAVSMQCGPKSENQAVNEESKVAWPDLKSQEETPELDLLKYSAAELKDKDPRLVLKRLKASLAAVRDLQPFDEHPVAVFPKTESAEEFKTDDVKHVQAPGVILERLKSSLAVLREMKDRLGASTMAPVVEDVEDEKDSEVVLEEAPEVVLARLKSTLRALREMKFVEAAKAPRGETKEEAPEEQLEQIRASLAALKETKSAEAAKEP